MDQVDSDGKPIGVLPAILLVPTALSALGSQLFKSLELRDTTAATKFPVANPHQGKFRVEVSRYLGNASYPGNSTKAFYLLSDPNDLPVIEVAFLNGQESPTIETADADFNVLGVQMRGYHDFGVARPEPARLAAAIGEAYAGRSDSRVAYARHVASREYAAPVMGRRWSDLCQHVLHERMA
ncbi:MAG: hypothetical protein U0939_11900 [Pirellulales bacterium]